MPANYDSRLTNGNARRLGLWRVAALLPFSARLILRTLGSAVVCAALSASSDAGRSKFNEVLSVGDAAPVWNDLPGTDDKQHSLADLNDAKVVVVVFTCNHCPMAAAYERRIVALAKDYAEKRVQVVAISVSRHEADGPEKMKARAQQRQYPFLYLYDESQAIGRAFGATCTPHFFVLTEDRKIAYMGAFDDNADAEKVEKRYVADAVEALLQGRPPGTRESLQRGCPIEYE
jgi:peroxiredoxin